MLQTTFSLALQQTSSRNAGTEVIDTCTVVQFYVIRVLEILANNWLVLTGPIGLVALTVNFTVARGTMCKNVDSQFEYKNHAENKKVLEKI